MEQDGGETDNIVVGPRGFITLAQPRPGTARRQNEYIETPLRPQLPEPPKVAAKAPLKDEALCRPGRLLLPGRQGAITAQPGITKKDSSPAASGGAAAATDSADQSHNDSIICRQCRKCRCEACRNPRHLPSRWVCNNKCLCSAANIVDYCSCMCCVRGLFYHWAKDYEMDTDVSCADQPCSCAPHQRLLRWGCLGLLSLPLPCLCCYWPLRGCLKGCEGCYAGCSGQGCRCPPHRTAPEKRLLDSPHSDC